MNNILLCGFMGCGKTTVGKYLSKQLMMEYIDLDLQIEQEEGIAIPEIFARHGESYFRELEYQAIKNLSRRIACVVSTGGGAMTFLRNQKAVDSKDHVVFLDASFEVCYRRIEGSDRPLLRNNRMEQLQELYVQRRTLYLQAATACVNADSSFEKVAEEIIRLLKK